ncbi:MAG: PKD domain-containing protein [Phycisphaerae bacterium]
MFRPPRRPPCRPPGAVLAALVLAAVAPPACADQAPWWNTDWTARRVVDCAAREAGYTGGEVGVVTFYTGGMARPDAADIRVAVQGRRLVGHRVLQVGPGDLVRVAFEAVPDLERYYVYFGNPAAEAVEPFEIRRGLLLEVRMGEAGSQPGTLEAFRKAWREADPVGADFVPEVSLGYNPFMDSRRSALLHFTGYFVPPRPGTYDITTSSQGGSWLHVDEQPVVAWPGDPGPSGRVPDSRSEQLPLTRRPHRLDYRNATSGGRTVAVAAWRTPEQKGKAYAPIPADAFLPIARGRLVEMDLKGEPLVADFFPEHAGEAWWPDRYAVRMRFRNLSKGISTTGGTFIWNFGDGQTATDPEPEHVYLADGDYKVTLQARRGTRSHTFETVVHVDRHWRAQDREEIDDAGDYARTVAAYDLATLDLRNLALAVDLFEHEKLQKPLIAAASELVFNRKGMPDEQVLETGLLLGESLRTAEQYQDALRTYERLEGRLQRRDRKARAAVRIGETMLRDLRQYDAAGKAYRRVLETYRRVGASWELRRAHVGLGDIYRHRGKGEEARKAYAAARAIEVAPRPPRMEAVRIGTLARYVEEYTREQNWEYAFKYLDEWAWEFPLAKLEGHWSLLRARALRAKGDREAALREALDLTGANPDSAYAVRLLMLAAECYVERGNREKARLLLQTAVEDYPEDAHHAEARRRLQALGGPVESGAEG